MSIMDFFRTAAPVAGQQAAASPNPNAAPDPSKTSSGTAPGANTPKSDGSVAAIPAAGEGEKSPLAGFDKLWEKDKDAKPPASLVPDLKVDPAKLLEGAKNIDFTKAINAEDLQKASKGDATAMASVINQAVQASFAQSTNTTANIVKAALTEQEKVFNEKIIPDILRKHNISTALRADNPLFDNPAVAPMLSMVETQFAAKFPGASATEITQKAKEYLQAFSTELLTGAGKTIGEKPTAAALAATQRKANEQDWSKFFGEASAS